MEQIKTTYKALIPSLCWSWILAFIPTGIKALDIWSKKYTYDENQIIIKTGILHQKQESIPFYRISDISATQNIIDSALKCGDITIFDKTKIRKIEYIENPDEIATKLRNLVFAARKDTETKAMEIL